MEDVRVLKIKQSVFANNDAHADELRERLHAQGTFLLNLMSSPGSGKTTTLARTIEALRDEMSLAVMEADIDSDVDAKTIAQTGARAIQLHTGGMCHLDAYMTEQGLDALLGEDSEHVDLAILENVGNLVCPAEFDTGACANAMILSVPEGDDKPLKYPLMFSIATSCLSTRSTRCRYSIPLAWSARVRTSLCATPMPPSFPSAPRRAKGSTGGPSGFAIAWLHGRPARRRRKSTHLPVPDALNWS